MAYLGTSPLIGKFQKLDDISSGFNDSQTSFTLQSSGVNVEPGSPQQLLVSIDGVLQEPVGAFTLTGSTITFSEAPNTNATFFAILLGETGIVNTISDGVIDSAKLQANAVIHTKLAADAVGTPQIKDSEVTLAKLAPGTIPVINAANIENNAVETAKIQDDAVTNLKISPNIVLRGTTTFMGAALEKANVVTGNALMYSRQVINIDNQDSGVVFFVNPSHEDSEHTVNFTNMNHVEVGNTTSFVVVLTNNTTNKANITKVQIQGDSTNLFFFSGITNSGTAGSVRAITEAKANLDVYSFSVIKTDLSSYTTIGSLTNFGDA